MDEGGNAIFFKGRSHPRFSVSLPIDYWHVDSVKRQTGRTGNISEKGTLIYVPEKMETGKNVRLKVFFSNPLEMNSIDVLGEVVWNNGYWRNEGGYQIGMKYVDISPEDTYTLKSFLNTLTPRITEELLFPYGMYIR